MTMRLGGKIAMVVGAGQCPGEGRANGRATAMLFAREGAKVLAVDRDLASARETVRIIRGEGGEAEAFEADVINEERLKQAVANCVARWVASTCCTIMSVSVSRAVTPRQPRSPKRHSTAS